MRRLPTSSLPRINHRVCHLILKFYTIVTIFIVYSLDPYILFFSKTLISHSLILIKLKPVSRHHITFKIRKSHWNPISSHLSFHFIYMFYESLISPSLTSLLACLLPNNWGMFVYLSSLPFNPPSLHPCCHNISYIFPPPSLPRATHHFSPSAAVSVFFIVSLRWASSGPAGLDSRPYI